ncbi:MAG TPA: hypothetical protein VJT09_16690 [Pyrinomonadaceae bacterium]|nr:hypothetical protein [Pyrinomonadaceae bacterium]
MIFKSNTRLDITQEIIALGNYYPYWHITASGRRARNWDFNAHSEAILNLKYRDEEDPHTKPDKVNKKHQAIEHFRCLIDSELTALN